MPELPALWGPIGMALQALAVSVRASMPGRLADGFRGREHNTLRGLLAGARWIVCKARDTPSCRWIGAPSAVERQKPNRTFCGTAQRMPGVDALSQVVGGAGDAGGVASMPTVREPPAAGHVGQQAERLMYRLYGMYLAVPPARKVAEEAALLNGDTASTVFGPA